jgi:hypothetical protein
MERRRHEGTKARRQEGTKKDTITEGVDYNDCLNRRGHRPAFAKATADRTAGEGHGVIAEDIEDTEDTARRK